MRPPSSTATRTVGGWLTTGTWTIMDQALFAGSNFVVNVLLARWLSPEGYGAYTVAYTLFLFLGTIHGGLLLEPMLVFGPGRFEKRLRHYLRVLLTGHAWFSLFAGLVLAIAAGGFALAGQYALAQALAVLSVAQAAILFLWLIRGACYIRTQPQISAIAGIGYSVILLGGAAIENQLGALTVTSALELMAIASLLAGGWLVWRLKIPLRRADDPALLASTVKEHREYGKWSAATGGMEWFHGFLPFLILPIWAGLEGTGALRALFNFILPVLHVYHALGNLIVPLLVRARSTGTHFRTAIFIGGGLLLLSLAYAITLSLFGPDLMHWLYDGKYDGYAHLLWLAGLLPLGTGLVLVMQSLLRAMERPRDVFIARGSAAAVAATLGTACVWAFGVAGALISDMLAAVTDGLVMLRHLRNGSEDTPVRVQSVEPTAPGRKKILMVAYACGPGRGSEPGQGWQFASGVAAHHDVWVMVYEGFRTAIESRLAESPIPGLHVVYHRLPLERHRHWQDGEDRRGLAEQLHYYLWHRTAAAKARALHRVIGFDLSHHVSFMRYWSPSAAAAPDVPFLWGPIGGGESAPSSFYKSFGRRGRCEEHIRDFARVLANRDRSVRHTAQRATLTLAATAETAIRARQVGAAPIEVRDGVALSDAAIDLLGTLPTPDGGPLRFVSVGRLLHWKGFGYGLKAFARAIDRGGRGMENAVYDIVGDGPERKRLESLVEALHLQDRVRFHGMIPRPEVLALLGRAHVLVHPSFHDCGGYATLEGMAAGRPIICLALGGPNVQVTPDTGIAIEAVTPEQITSDLADAFLRLARDPALQQRMGAAGRERVRAEFRWPVVIERTLARYEDMVSLSPSGDGVAEGLPVWARPEHADTHG